MSDKKPDSARQARELCRAILTLQGKKYNDWLQEKHTELIMENGDYIAEKITRTENK